MKHQTPTTQATKAGTSNNSLGNLIEENNKELGPLTHSEINQFLDAVTRAKMFPELKDGDTLPSIEVSRNVCAYYNKDMAAFDKVGYFTFNGVNVYEKGKKEEAQKRDAQRAIT